MCAGRFRGVKSSNRIELSRFVQELLLFFWFGFPRLWRVGQVGGGCPGWSAIVYMSSGMFRGKESSNRIELSWLVQDIEFCCFGLPVALGVGGLGGMGVWGGGGGLGGWGCGVVGGCPPHTCTCTCTHACTHTHVSCVVNMIIPCKWLPPLDLGKSRGFPMMSYVRARACMRMHVHVGGVHLLTTPHPHPPTSLPPSGGTPGISQNSIALELIEIFQFCLKIWNLWRFPYPWVGV